SARVVVPVDVIGQGLARTERNGRDRRCRRCGGGLWRGDHGRGLLLDAARSGSLGEGGRGDESGDRHENRNSTKHSVPPLEERSATLGCPRRSETMPARKKKDTALSLNCRQKKASDVWETPEAPTHATERSSVCGERILTVEENRGLDPV